MALLLGCGLAAACRTADDAAAESALPVPGRVRWWKGNLHTHTFWSDGDDFPETVADWYRERGYHFLALSDHNVLARGVRWVPEADLVKRGGPAVVTRCAERFGAAWVERRGSGDAAQVRLKPLDEFRALVEERGRFLLIPAEEISDTAEGVPLHICATNIAEPIQPLGGATIVEAINANLRAVHDQAEKAGREILAHLNHPNFHYAITPHDLAHAVIERHFEVFNGQPKGNQQGDARRPGVDRLWDIANTIRLVDLAAPPPTRPPTPRSGAGIGTATRNGSARCSPRWRASRPSIASPAASSTCGRWSLRVRYPPTRCGKARSSRPGRSRSAGSCPRPRPLRRANPTARL